MHMDRRRVLVGMGALGLYGLPQTSFARTSLQLGPSEITILSDGHLVLPGSYYFDGLPQEELAPILSKYEVPRDQVKSPCNLTLLRRGENNILFDAGSGAGFMPSAGEMLDSLDAEGLSRDDITHVVFTHGHPDHLWGILDDFDDLVFPNAQVLFGQGEWDYWRDPETVDTIRADRQSFAVGAARRLEAIEDHASFFNDGDEILPGVLAHSTPGHTPGHMSFEIREGSEALMVGGDAIVNGHVAFERPDWPSSSDQDPELGIKTRQRLLDQLATDQVPLIGFHLPNGGLGRVERNGEHYHFVPEDA